MSKHHFTSIIFDLDGTLINTAPDVRLALNHTLATYGHPPIAPSEIYALIGEGAKVLIRNAFAKSNVHLTDQEIAAALNCYLTYYQANPVIETVIYPGVKEGLENFHNQGIKMGICTNKPAVMTHLVLEKLKLHTYFSAIIAGDEVAHPKPNGKHIHAVLDQMQIDPAQTVMVGDSHIDMASAENAGIPFIGVSYGYDLTLSAKCLVIKHFLELPAALSSLANLGVIAV